MSVSHTCFNQASIVKTSWPNVKLDIFEKSIKFSFINTLQVNWDLPANFP